MALLESQQVNISMAAVGCPEENGFAERWMRTLKDDHVTLSEYADFADARRQIGEFIEQVYQYKRVHSSLSLPGERRVALPPAIFEQRWYASKAGKDADSRGENQQFSST